MEIKKYKKIYGNKSFLINSNIELNQTFKNCNYNKKKNKKNYYLKNKNFL